jgi:hypothetical protein
MFSEFDRPTRYMIYGAILPHLIGWLFRLIRKYWWVLALLWAIQHVVGMFNGDNARSDLRLQNSSDKATVVTFNPIRETDGFVTGIRARIRNDAAGRIGEVRLSCLYQFTATGANDRWTWIDTQTNSSWISAGQSKELSFAFSQDVSNYASTPDHCLAFYKLDADDVYRNSGRADLSLTSNARTTFETLSIVPHPDRAGMYATQVTGTISNPSNRHLRKLVMRCYATMVGTNQRESMYGQINIDVPPGQTRRFQGRSNAPLAWGRMRDPSCEVTSIES